MARTKRRAGGMVTNGGGHLRLSESMMEEKKKVLKVIASAFAQMDPLMHHHVGSALWLYWPSYLDESPMYVEA